MPVRCVPSQSLAVHTHLGHIAKDIGIEGEMLVRYVEMAL